MDIRYYLTSGHYKSVSCCIPLDPVGSGILDPVQNNIQYYPVSGRIALVSGIIRYIIICYQTLLPLIFMVPVFNNFLLVECTSKS